MAAGNYEFSRHTYNANIGPCVMFPKLLGPYTLFVNASYWLALSESRDKVLVLAGLLGRIF